MTPSAVRVDTLREADIASNTSAGDDTINLTAGTFTLSLGGLGEDAAATGDLDLTDTTGTLVIQGAGADQTIIDASSIDRVFQLLSGVTVEIHDVTIQGGIATDDLLGLGGASGGGILNSGTLSIFNSVVSGNAALASSGLPSSPGPLGSGGGIHSSGSLKIQGSLIAGNQVFGGNGGTAFSFTDGDVGGDALGGGIFAETGSIDISNSTIFGNITTPGHGGTGGRGFTGTAFTSQITTSFGGLITNTFGGTGGNGAAGGAGGNGRGGGIFVNTASIDLTNTTIADNDVQLGAGGNGGPGGTGDFAPDGAPGASGSEGQASGGGIENIAGIVFAKNTLIGGNVNGLVAPDFSGAFDVALLTLLQNSDGASGIANGVNSNLVGVIPLISPLANHGGPTATHALLLGSPAIDAGAAPAINLARLPGAIASQSSVNAPFTGARLMTTSAISPIPLTPIPRLLGKSRCPPMPSSIL